MNVGHIHKRCYLPDTPDTGITAQLNGQTELVRVPDMVCSRCKEKYRQEEASQRSFFYSSLASTRSTVGCVITFVTWATINRPPHLNVAHLQHGRRGYFCARPHRIGGLGRITLCDAAKAPHTLLRHPICPAFPPMVGGASFCLRYAAALGVCSLPRDARASRAYGPQPRLARGSFFWVPPLATSEFLGAAQNQARGY